MTYITNILFWISSGLLIPVIILLLLSFLWSLLSLGELYGNFMWRVKNKKKIKEFENGLLKNGIKDIEHYSLVKEKNSFSDAIKKIKEINFDKVHSEKILIDFETENEKNTSSSTILTRTGPMLGLMGTLIPMGPALTGLASGDIASMATNMQVAFATTVIGIFIGGTGFLVNLMNSRWNQDDLFLLEHVIEIAWSDENEKK